MNNKIITSIFALIVFTFVYSCNKNITPKIIEEHDSVIKIIEERDSMKIIYNDSNKIKQLDKK